MASLVHPGNRLSIDGNEPWRALMQFRRESWVSDAGLRYNHEADIDAGIPPGDSRNLFQPPPDHAQVPQDNTPAKPICIICMHEPSTIAFLHGDRCANLIAYPCAWVPACVPTQRLGMEQLGQRACSHTFPCGTVQQPSHVLLRGMRQHLHERRPGERQVDMPILQAAVRGCIHQLHCVR